MLFSDPLTNDAIDRIADAATRGDETGAFATRLVTAVDEGRLADDVSPGVVLGLAAEFTAEGGDLAAAETLAARAAAAQRDRGDDDAYLRAYRAELLLQLDRLDEGMTELTALRPLLLEDPDAIAPITEALESGGRTEVAEQWLTEALETALDRRTALEHRVDTPELDDASFLAFTLLQERHRVRHELELPHDEHDDLAEELADAIEEEFGQLPDALLFWPSAEFAQATRLWPELVEVFGATWGEHRAGLEGQLVAAQQSPPVPVLVAGKAEDLAGFAAANEGDPRDLDVLDGYLAQLMEAEPGLRWPPDRNEQCWCGSGDKYKKCCLPRGRD